MYEKHVWSAWEKRFLHEVENMYMQDPSMTIYAAVKFMHEKMLYRTAESIRSKMRNWGKKRLEATNGKSS